MGVLGQRVSVFNSEPRLMKVVQNLVVLLGQLCGLCINLCKAELEGTLCRNTYPCCSSRERLSISWLCCSFNCKKKKLRSAEKEFPPEIPIVIFFPLLLLFERWSRFILAYRYRHLVSTTNINVYDFIQNIINSSFRLRNTIKHITVGLCVTYRNTK